MSISRIGSNTPITRLQGSKATQSTQSSQDVSTSGSDTVEISDSARYLSELKNMPDVRSDKVQAARDAIANGGYDSDEAIDGTVDAMMQELSF